MLELWIQFFWEAKVFSRKLFHLNISCLMKDSRYAIISFELRFFRETFFRTIQISTKLIFSQKRILLQYNYLCFFLGASERVLLRKLHLFAWDLHNRNTYNKMAHNSSNSPDDGTLSFLFFSVLSQLQISFLSTGGQRLQQKETNNIDTTLECTYSYFENITYQRLRFKKKQKLIALFCCSGVYQSTTC
jgi:hypothetical protein